MTNNELCHHGILGQKWGVRRYQYEDGTRTPAGKRRRRETDISNLSNDELRAKVNRLSNEQRYMELTRPSASRATRVVNDVDLATGLVRNVNRGYRSVSGDNNPYSKLIDANVDIASRSTRLGARITTNVRNKKSAEVARQKLATMSDSDLAKEVERLDLERRYSSLQADTMNRGKTKISEILSVAGDVVGISASAIGIAVGIKKLINK